MGIAVDSYGNLYVADASNNKIRKISASGYVSTIAGSGSNGINAGQGTSASFSGARGIVLDSNENLYIADVLQPKIHKVLKVSSA